METSGSSSSGKTTGVSEENSDSESDDSSSSSSALDSFRREWKNELKDKKTTGRKQMTHKDADEKENIDLSSKEKTIEEEATEYFLEGVKYEREGQLYDAVKHYRRAIQLVPDIETRLSDIQTPHVKKKKKEKHEFADKNNKDEEEILLKNFLLEIEAKGWVYFDKSVENEQTHISALPSEVISYILRWVVSCDLDMRSLDVLSGTSRGMYCLCRDEELWKLACKKMWNLSTLSLDKYSTYREMFLRKPRLRFDGVYISRVTYVRSGEQSFQDHWYRPWHLVEYFRYLRLFPNGEVYFLTSAEQPKNAVFGLRSNNRPQDPSTLRGRYCFVQEGRVSIHLEREPITNPHKKRRGEVESNKIGTSYYLELDIVPLKKTFKHNLIWKNYTVKISRQHARGGMNEMNSTESGFDINSTHFPPFYFSRVKSFNKVSEKILE